MREHRAVKILIGIFVAVFIFHQIYSSLYKPITTQSADFYTAVDGLSITGTVIRQEYIITGSTLDTLHFAVSNGSRVAKGGTVAQIYDSTASSMIVLRIEEINQKIADINELESYNDVQAADIDLASAKINSALSAMISDTAAGDYSLAASDSTALLSALNRKRVITGEQTDFSAQLAALNSELASLSATLPAPKGVITAETSGYFVSLTDGYENVLTGTELEKITPEYLASVKPEATDKNSVGKIVSDYEWYIAARVPLNDSLKYKEGDSLTIKTSVKSSPTLPVTVKKINLSSKGDSAVIIFACQQMNSDLAGMRTGAMTVVNKEYSGLKVPKKSLRVVDGKTGVYIVSGITVKFVPVNVIYSTSDYVICEQKQTNDETVLRLYDEVVVKGKKLYDGKIIG